MLNGSTFIRRELMIRIVRAFDDGTLENELDQIPAEWRDKVEIEARTCLELCEKENLGGAPYVRINDAEIMAQATPEKLLTRIGELLEGAV